MIQLRIKYLWKVRVRSFDLVEFTCCKWEFSAIDYQVMKDKKIMSVSEGESESE